MDLATLERTTIDACYARLRELIMDAELLPNSHHLAITIAHRLGSDQDTVIEACQLLQHDGLVTVEPRGGFWVAPLRPADVIDAFRQASMLEARAAFVAALHSPSSIGMAALDDALLRMEDALFRYDLSRWARANHHFHRSLVQCSGHTGLIAAALPLSDAIHRARMLTLRLGPMPVEATQRHSQVVEAIRRGLATDARDIHLDYWRTAAIAIVGLLEDNRLDCMSA